ncbi:pseudouridine-5'-phosphate glycosidase [Salibacterium qingdaonense]|uniref:Pseudouridine-5'-phosphate glycosidase n=1 Tax=Salibacterium qingdaonense TaxID=266892 RepID=A0A1I4QBC4_9BACI|nr:pseudouridine-5'-phosphate glycosidase [Salibacterium qingdaonense]SFM36930.1 pseudouridine-5'-phosphate glycosidase [Salibacterium qingdaonense]
MKSFITLSEEVRTAQEEGKPVVALESTIISHGMPYPQNVQTARDVEQIIRDGGAVPATIALLDGQIKIGLSNDELDLLARSEDVTKASRKDLPYLAATGKHGATTVAATMICAAMADIPVFVTGGIGGVHRGAEHSMDISADLEELARTNVAVVCSGAKSILDLGLTMEYLETKGVPVMGYKTDQLPAFFTRSSEFPVHFRVDEADEAASTLHAKWGMEMEGGAVVANPIPEDYAMKEEFISGVIEEAVQEAENLGMTGKDVTPFLLQKIQESTGGQSLDANIALVKHNAEVGAAIAAALNKKS